MRGFQYHYLWVIASSRRQDSARPEMNNLRRRQMKLNTVINNQFIKTFNQDESGQDMLEYALILLTVLVAVVAGSTNLSGVLTNELSTLSSNIAALDLP
jgi:Flp pilus assembly pilin Flp